MAGHTYSPEEITARGEAIYRERIRSLVETKEKGKFVIIDIETGDYEIARDVTATLKLLERRPLLLCGAHRLSHSLPYRRQTLDAQAMITGKINHYLEAVIIVDFVGSDGLLHSLEAVLDTGYNGDLTLPQNVIQQLGLVLLGRRSATLANGESVVLNAYLGTVSWHDFHAK